MTVRKPPAVDAPPPPSSGSSLRQRAVATLRKLASDNPAAQKSLSADETQLLLQEMSVYQLELEMQNDELRRAQVELDISRARYVDLYDFAPVGYCTLSAEGVIQDANLTSASLLGAARGSLLGQPFIRFIHQGDRDVYFRHSKLLAASGVVHACELRMRKQDGAEFWALIKTTATEDAAGNVLHRTVMSDVSDRREAEEALRMSEAFQLAIINSVRAEIAVLDRDGMILSVNNAWQRFALENAAASGWAESSIGTNYLAVCRPAEGNAAMGSDAHAGIRAVLDGRLPEFSMEYPCHSPQHQRWFSMNVTPMVADARDRVVITHTEITTRKLAEIALEQSELQLKIALDGERSVSIATGITMMKYRLDHQAAFERLRDGARSQRRSLAELAAEVIVASESLNASQRKARIKN